MKYSCLRELPPLAHAELRGRGNQRAGLIGQNPQVVGDRVIAGLRPHRLVQLAQAEPLEDAGLQSDGLLAEAPDEGAGTSEEEVSGEDGDGVAPDAVGTRHPTPHHGVVHHVVVVQRGEMGDLQSLRGDDDTRGVAGAELRGEQRQRGADAFTARVEQVPAGDVSERVAE